MMVTQESLVALESHWALQAVGRDQQDQALQLSESRFVQQALMEQISLDLPDWPSHLEFLERVATAYEVAAAEGLDAVLYGPAGDESDRLRAQAQAGAYRAYEIIRILPTPSADEARIFHVLHLAALAYCGERWAEIRRWLKEHPPESSAPSAAGVPWDRRLLYRLFDCWVRLLRKNQWDDLDGVRGIIAGLREDQKRYEPDLLEPPDEGDARAVALRLVVLYHWARATELLAIYMLQGEPAAVDGELNRHFEAAHDAAVAAQDATLEMLIRWLHVAARRMVAGSLWQVAQNVNSRVTRFVNSVTKAPRPIFELLPPQRAALQDQGLLDPASRAVVVDMPTSGGKTVLAEFRILQALNQFAPDHGWVAYVAPTRALVAQLTRRLRADFGPLGIPVEQLTAAVDIDSFEEGLLDDRAAFQVLVATPEKLQMVIRNRMPSRPLALVVMDEAHNIEDEERGLRIELLLATIKRDRPSANFLLLMPFVPNAQDLARWLADDAGRTISISTSAWQPNERVVGMFDAKPLPQSRGSWRLEYETLTTTPKTIRLTGKHQVGRQRPLDMPFNEAKSLTKQTAAMAKVFSSRGTSIGVADRVDNAWEMARIVADNLDPLPEYDEVKLVQRFLQTEISPDFELVKLLDKGVGVHHAGLSEEARALMEWLAEIGRLRVLCATSGIAQGINFPVSSVFLATHLHPYGKRMSSREFWNLAGRAGRMDQDSVGVVGIAIGKRREEIREFVGAKTGDLVSRLVGLLDQLEETGQLQNLATIIYQEEWTAFRTYVAHLWTEKKNLDAVLQDTEQLLRNTYGYGALQGKPKDRAKARALLDATRVYARGVRPNQATLADATGFAPEGVQKAMDGLRHLDRDLRPSDWQPASLFGSQVHSVLPALVGVMMRIPQLRKELALLGSHGQDNMRIAEVAQAWVTGRSIQEIAQSYFSKTPQGKAQSDTEAITAACRGIYRTLANYGTWGLSALAKMPGSGIDFDHLSDAERRIINNLPAMLYHGVSSDEAVLMRMNSVPRSVAEPLGRAFLETTGPTTGSSPRMARQFLRELGMATWGTAVPQGGSMSGEDYRTVWSVLSGETF